MADWPGLGSGRLTSGQPDSNSWGHQRENDTSDVVRRGVLFESITAGQIIKYGNANRLYLMSATTGSDTTVVFGSATTNTGAEYIVRNRTAGNVIVSTAGGTMVGSATQSSAGAISIWRSDGSDWLRLFNSDSVIADPLQIGSLGATGSASFSGSVNFVGVVDFRNRAEFHACASFSNSVHFGIMPTFPTGLVTSVPGGAQITFAGNLFYEISTGAGAVQLILPAPATVMGARASVKFLPGGTGTILLSSAAGRINPTAATATACATITMSALASYATFVAGQTNWWIV